MKPGDLSRNVLGLEHPRMSTLSEIEAREAARVASLLKEFLEADKRARDAGHSPEAIHKTLVTLQEKVHELGAQHVDHEARTSILEKRSDVVELRVDRLEDRVEDSQRFILDTSRRKSDRAHAATQWWKQSGVGWAAAIVGACLTFTLGALAPACMRVIKRIFGP